MSVPNWVVNLLQCPSCGRELKEEIKSFRCSSCCAEYEIHESIPMLIPKSS